MNIIPSGSATRLPPALPMSTVELEHAALGRWDQCQHCQQTSSSSVCPYYSALPGGHTEWDTSTHLSVSPLCRHCKLHMCVSDPLPPPVCDCKYHRYSSDICVSTFHLLELLFGNASNRNIIEHNLQKLELIEQMCVWPNQPTSILQVQVKLTSNLLNPNCVTTQNEWELPVKPPCVLSEISLFAWACRLHCTASLTSFLKFVPCLCIFFTPLFFFAISRWTDAVVLLWRCYVVKRLEAFWHSMLTILTQESSTPDSQAPRISNMKQRQLSPQIVLHNDDTALHRIHGFLSQMLQSQQIAIGCDIALSFYPQSPGKVPRSSWCHNSKACKELNFQPLFSFQKSQNVRIDQRISFVVRFQNKLVWHNYEIIVLSGLSFVWTIFLSSVLYFSWIWRFAFCLELPPHDQLELWQLKGVGQNVVEFSASTSLFNQQGRLFARRTNLIAPVPI